MVTRCGQVLTTLRLVRPTAGEKLGGHNEQNPIVGRLAAGARIGLANALASSTARKNSTAVKHWLIYTENDLGIHSVVPITANSSRYQMTEEEINVRVTLAIGFAVKLQTGDGKWLQAHAKEKTTWGYLQEVNTWHHGQIGYPLFPHDKHIEKEIKKVIRGLAKMKPGSTWHRRGLELRHVLRLNQSTREMCGQEIKLSAMHKCSRLVDEELIANIISLRTFAWQQLFRLGEATITEPRLWNQPLEAGKRPSRADLLGLYDDDQLLHGFQLPALGYKCSNLHTDADLIMMIHTDDDLNAGRDLLHLLEVDDATGDPDAMRRPLREVPLWRFPPVSAGEVQDVLSNTTLTPAFLMELDRLIIDRNPGDYHPIQSKEIGGHSYRIGGCSALLAAGAPMLVIQAMGRWSSDCFLLYCRQGKRQKDFWMRKMLSAGDEEVSAVYDENSAWAGSWHLGPRL